MAEIAVSVIIPVKDGEATLAACLDGLLAQRGSLEFEVVVVDNGSRDRTAAIARAHPVGASVLAESRPGSYAARNAGVAAASAPVLAFTDADCIPDPGWLAAGLAALAAGADLVGGRVTAVTGERPNRWEEYDGRRYLDQRRFVERMSFAATANLFARRAVFEDVGGFDASLLSGGDLEFGQRAVAAGHQLTYSHEASVTHRPRASLRQTWKLHRRIGAGIAVLQRTGRGPGDAAPPPPRAAEPRATRLRRHLRLGLPHATAKLAAFVGRVTARG